MILHTVNKSPLQSKSLGSCLQFLARDDGVVLLEDGVYAAMRNVDFGLDEAGVPVFAIEADVAARGLTSRLRDDVEVIDYQRFVELCAGYDVIKNWS